jgi:hypothetical protein
MPTGLVLRPDPSRSLRRTWSAHYNGSVTVRWRSSRMRASSAFRPPPATTIQALPSRLAVIGPREA